MEFCRYGGAFCRWLSASLRCFGRVCSWDRPSGATRSCGRYFRCTSPWLMGVSTPNSLRIPGKFHRLESARRICAIGCRCIYSHRHLPRWDGSSCGINFEVFRLGGRHAFQSSSLRFFLRAVFWNGAESLASIAKDVSLFREQADRAQSATLPESVFFIPKWADRVYFPERRVAVDLEGKNVVK